MNLLEIENTVFTSKRIALPHAQGKMKDSEPVSILFSTGLAQNISLFFDLSIAFGEFLLRLFSCFYEANSQAMCQIKRGKRTKKKFKRS